MIDRVDAYLETVFGAALKGQPATVSFDSPPAAPTANRATGNLLLFDVREELERRSGSDEDIYNGDRRVGKRPPTRYYRLRYLITAQAKDTREEHRLLGEIIENLPVPPFGNVESSNGDADAEPIFVELAHPPLAGAPSITDMWSALGMTPRASLELHAITRVRAVEESAGVPVEHLVLDVERSDTSGARREPTTRIVRRWSTTKVNEGQVE